MGIFSRIADANKKKNQFLLGAVKGLGSTISTIGEMGDMALNKTVGAGVSALTGRKNVKPVGMGGTEKSLEKLGVKDAFTPTNNAQKVGFGAEQIGEFFVPGGAVAKGAKAIEVAAGASKLAKVAKALGTATKVAGEGLASGGVTLAQGGDVKEARNATLLGGAGATIAPVAKGASEAFKKYMGEKVAPRVINSLIKPVSKEFEFGKNAGAGVIREGIKANTRGELLEKISLKKEELGKMIGDKLAPLQDKIDLTPAVNQIDEALKKANRSGETALAARLRDVKSALTNDFDELTGEVIGKKDLLVTPLEARKMKTTIGEAARWTGQAFDNDVNQARVSVYRAINDLIDKTAPGVKELNSRFADMLSAERSMQRTIDIAERQNMVGLVPTLVGANAASIVAGGAGTVQGLAQGQDLGKAMATGIGLAAATKVAGSTAAKTRLFAPLAKNLGVSADALVNVITKNNIPISGTLAKFIDALNRDAEISPGDTPQESSVETPTKVDVPMLQSQYPPKYNDFIEAAIEKGYSQVEVMHLLNEKVKEETAE